MRHEPSTWREAQKHLDAIVARQVQILVDLEPEIDAAFAAACCTQIGEVFAGFRRRAWTQAVREHEAGRPRRFPRRARSRQYLLFPPGSTKK